jgi:hypothetical protein
MPPKNATLYLGFGLELEMITVFLPEDNDTTEYNAHKDVRSMVTTLLNSHGYRAQYIGFRESLDFTKWSVCYDLSIHCSPTFAFSLVPEWEREAKKD